MSEPEVNAPEEPSIRDVAAALIALNIQEKEAQVYQAQAQLQMLQVNLQAAKIRASFEVERLVKQMSAD